MYLIKLWVLFEMKKLTFLYELVYFLNKQYCLDNEFH